MKMRSWLCGLLVAVMGVVMAGCGGSSDGGGSGGAFAGNYVGAFYGTDQGTLSFVIDDDGTAAGTAYSTMEGLGYLISGSVSGSGELSAGLYTDGFFAGTYQGTIDEGGAVRGTWESEDGLESGTFDAQRQ